MYSAVYLIYFVFHSQTTALIRIGILSLLILFCLFVYHFLQLIY